MYLLPLGGNGEKEGLEDGEVKLCCRSEKALVSPMGKSGSSTTSGIGPKGLGLYTHIAVSHGE